MNNTKAHFWKAANSITANFRWCLTGTPIQNKVDDMMALRSFIKYKFVQNEKKWISDWKMEIESSRSRVRKQAYQKIQAILGPVVLRRTQKDKIGGTRIVSLPKREDFVLDVSLQGEEAELYKALEKEAGIKCKNPLASGKTASAQRNVLTNILRLRQVL